MNKYILKDGAEIESIPINKLRSIHIGDRFSRLVVLDRGPDSPARKSRVICQCDCGKIILAQSQDVKEGKVCSCGCLNAEQSAKRCKENAKDWTKTEFNVNPFYEYIAPTEERYHGQRIYIIKCRKCGRLHKGCPCELLSEKRSHGTNPCDCWRTESHGVTKIKTVLKQNNILFEQEKIFSTCLSYKGYPLRFDFFLPEYHIIIEYDGQQHYQIAFGQDAYKLQLQQEYDKIKDIWCKENNIQLIRIPYYDYDKIDVIIKEIIDEQTI